MAEAVDTLLQESGLPPSFWRVALNFYIHSYNRTPTSTLPNTTTPYTEWKQGKKPDVSYFRTFGCLAYVLIPKHKRKALAPHSRKCIFVGYPNGTKAWLFWDPERRKFYTSSHAVFDERYFPGNSPKKLSTMPEQSIALPDEGEEDESHPYQSSTTDSLQPNQPPTVVNDASPDAPPPSLMLLSSLIPLSLSLQPANYENAPTNPSTLFKGHTDQKKLLKIHPSFHPYLRILLVTHHSAHHPPQMMKTQVKKLLTTSQLQASITSTLEYKQTS